MAHYAFLDQNNVVTEVIVGVDENELIEGKSPEAWYTEFRGQRCVRTSYNGNIRKNFAGVGFTYDEKLDAFIPDKPFPSWVLDKSCKWVAPVAYPSGEVMYTWNEALGDWEPMQFSIEL
jgi:hypothetical protein